MLQFRNRPRPRDYFARREQVRLLLLVMFLMGVVWIAVEARDPTRYRWIWSLGAEKAANEPVDTRLRTSRSSEDDAFVVAAPDDFPGVVEPVSGPLADEDLESIRDGEPFRASERQAWFKLFERLQKTDSDSLRAESIGPVTFIQLYRQPKEYRGELVSLAGSLRRSERLTAPNNDVGIESYYRTWLSPNDHPSDPIVVYTLGMPEGFPQGMAIDEQVELEGYFFKRWPYVAQDGGRTAPVVLAKSVRWIPAKVHNDGQALSPLSVVGLAALLASALVFVVWWRTSEKKSAEPARDLFSNLPEDVASEANHLRLVTDTDEEERNGE